MHCYDTLATIEGGTGACVALGYFDGVHLGHRRVLARTVEAARERGCTSAVFTFAPPLDRAVKGRAILTPEEKARRIAAMGVEHYVRPPFEEFCTLSPEAFVHDVLAVRFGAKAVFCGDNFTFGSRKAGNVDMLRRLCAAAGISVEIVPMVQREGAPVSSSRIRACLWKLRAPCWGSLTASTFPYVTASGWGLRWAFPPSTKSIPIGCCFLGRAYM